MNRETGIALIRLAGIALRRYRKVRRSHAGRPNTHASWYVARHVARYVKRYGAPTPAIRLFVAVNLGDPRYAGVYNAAGVFTI